MAAISTLFAELHLHAEGFNNGLRESQRELKQFEKTWAPTINLVEQGAKIVVAAGVAIVGALATMTKVAADYGDAIRDASIRTGLATETLSGLKLMAEQNGASLDELSGGLKFLAKNMEAAIQRGGDQRFAFNDLGITVKELRDAHGQLEPVMLKVMDRLREMPDGAEKTAAMLAIMGKSSVALTEMMSQGSDALTLYLEKTRLLGIEVTPEAAAAADNFNDSLNILKQSLLGVSLTVGEELIPPLTVMIKFTAAAIIVTRQFSEQLIGYGKIVAAVAQAYFGSEGLNNALAALISVIPGGQTAVVAIAAAYSELDRMQAAVAASANTANIAHRQTKEELAAAEKAAREYEKSLKEMKVSVEGVALAVRTFSADFKEQNDAFSTRIKQLRQDTRDANVEWLEGNSLKMQGIIDLAKLTNSTATNQTEMEATEMAKQIKAWKERKAEEEKIARASEAMWASVMGNVTASISKGFADAIIPVRDFGNTALNIAAQTANGMLQAFLSGLLSPLNTALANLGKQLSGALSGAGGAGGAGGLLGALGGPLGFVGAGFAIGGLIASLFGGDDKPAPTKAVGNPNWTPTQLPGFSAASRSQQAPTINVTINGLVGAPTDIARVIGKELEKLTRTEGLVIQSA